MFVGYSNRGSGVGRTCVMRVSDIQDRWGRGFFFSHVDVILSPVASNHFASKTH